MNRRRFPFLLLALAYFVPAQANVKALRPNVILIFVDDLGYGDLGCYGNTTIKTPNIDQLAKEGQRWTSFYASGSTCVPSRTGLMSGRHPSGIGKKQRLRADPTALMPMMFKRTGYATAILGKWHLAGYPKDFTTDAMHPLECGFDYHYGTPGSNDVPAPKGKVQNRELFDNCHKTTFQVPLIRGREIIEFPVNQELLTKRYTQEAIRWIEKNKDDKFFLYLAHNMPHAPVFASPSFQNTSDAGRYGDVIQEVDWSVGAVMKAVKEHGLDQDTLIVFTSDNGPWTMFGPHGGTAKPLRGEKGTSWEGGYRVPGIFRWPGRIAPSTVDGIAANLDLYATFATLIGGIEPKNKPGYQSLDLSNTLLGRSRSPRKSWNFGGSAYRSGDWKILLRTKDRSSNPDTRKREPMKQHDPPLLFNLAEDVAESNNLAAEHPDIVQRLLHERNSRN